MNAQEKAIEDSDAVSTNRILFVDDEAFILFSLRRYFKQNNIEVDVETDCIKAVELIKENKYKVIISDFRMPLMNGAEFLEIAKDVSPESIRLVLSAHVTQESLQEIVNKSEIYRFVSKPWSDKNLLMIIQDSILKYDEELKRKNYFEKTFDYKSDDPSPEQMLCAPTVIDDFFQNSLPMKDYTNMDLKKQCEILRTEQHQHLNYIINLTSSKIGLHCKRVSQLSMYMGKTLKLSPEAQKDLYYAGLYHDIGKLFELVAQADHCEIGANLLSHFHELKNAANIIRFHHLRIDEEGGGQLSTECKILAIVDYFDKEVSLDKKHDDEKPRTLTDIIGSMLEEKGKRFDAEILDIFKEVILNDFKLEMFFNETKIHLTEIEDGMVLSRPLFNIEGKMLLNSEYKITKDVISRIYKHHKLTAIKSPFYVYTKAPDKVFNFEEFLGKKIKI